MPSTFVSTMLSFSPYLWFFFHPQNCVCGFSLISIGFCAPLPQCFCRTLFSQFFFISFSFTLILEEKTGCCLFFSPVMYKDSIGRVPNEMLLVHLLELGDVCLGFVSIPFVFTLKWFFFCHSFPFFFHFSHILHIEIHWLK